MEFTKRIFTAVLLTICLLFNCVAYAGSAAVMDPDEKLRIIEGLLEERWHAASQGDTDTVDKINQQLQSLQVEELTTADMVAKLYGDADAVPMFDLPTSNNKTWTTTRLTYHVDGVAYEVQYVYASPIANTDTALIDELSADVRRDVAYDIATTAYNLIVLTATTFTHMDKVQKAVVTIAEYLEVLLGGINLPTTVYRGSRIAYNAVNYTFLKLAFVKLASETDDAQKLQFITSYTETHIQCAFLQQCTNEEGHPDTIEVSGKYVAIHRAAEYQRPVYYIVSDYLNEESLRTNYVYTVPIYGGPAGSEGFVCSFLPFTPSGQAQIVVD